MKISMINTHQLKRWFELISFKENKVIHCLQNIGISAAVNDT